MKDPYETLGVNRDASKDSIRKAYRRRAQRAHPDSGGKAEEFHDLTIAYKLLTNDAKRARYDATGEAETVDNHRAAMLQELASMLLNVLNAVDERYDHPIEFMRTELRNRIKRQEAEIAKANRDIQRMTRARDRVLRKKPGQNFLKEFLDANIASTQRVIANMKSTIETFREMIVLLEEYDYSVDPRPPGAYSIRSFST